MNPKSWKKNNLDGESKIEKKKKAPWRRDALCIPWAGACSAERDASSERTLSFRSPRPPLCTVSSPPRPSQPTCKGLFKKKKKTVIACNKKEEEENNFHRKKTKTKTKKKKMSPPRHSCDPAPHRKELNRNNAKAEQRWQCCGGWDDWLWKKIEKKK